MKLVFELKAELKEPLKKVFLELEKLKLTFYTLSIKRPLLMHNVLKRERQGLPFNVDIEHQTGIDRLRHERKNDSLHYTAFFQLCRSLEFGFYLLFWEILSLRKGIHVKQVS